MGFNNYVCISKWISGCVCVSIWVLAFVFVFRRGFQAGFRALFAFWVCVSSVGFGLSLRFERGFQPLSTFRAGFLLVVLNLLVLIWVAHISTLFFGFSNLGFAHISARFFWFF